VILLGHIISKTPTIFSAVFWVVLAAALQAWAEKAMMHGLAVAERVR
jgi:hypothetical protein